MHPSQEERFRVIAGGALTTWVSGKESTLQTGEECIVPPGAGFPNRAAMAVMAALSVLGRMLGYTPAYPYPYGTTGTDSGEQRH